jgi:hypothetical protein
MARATRPRDVFINCPFDATYRQTFNAMVYVIIRSGFRPRCALETDDAAQNRFSKISDIVEECRYGIHDISYTGVDGDPPLPRFNMPLELGLFLGAKRFGEKPQKSKRCLVMDVERYRFQRFISDLAGQDIHAHGGAPDRVIEIVAAWLRQQSRVGNIPGGRAIAREYDTFLAELPAICAVRELEPEELTYGDFTVLVGEYLAVRV